MTARVTNNSRVQFDLFQYKSSAELMRAFHSAMKAEGKLFSWGTLARKLNVSRSYFPMVARGERLLNAELIPRLAQVMQLNQWETEYFVCLVKWENTQSTEEKQKAWENLARIASRIPVIEVEHAEKALLSSWIAPVLRALVATNGFRPDFNWLSERMSKRASAEEIKETFEKLVAEGSIRCENGQYSTPDEVQIAQTTDQSRAKVIAYHQQMISLGVSSIQDVKSDMRAILGGTFSIPSSRVARFQELAQAFRDEILDLAENYEKADEVYQLNIQFFPLTKRVG